MPVGGHFWQEPGRGSLPEVVRNTVRQSKIVHVAHWRCLRRERQESADGQGVLRIRPADPVSMGRHCHEEPEASDAGKFTVPGWKTKTFSD